MVRSRLGIEKPCRSDDLGRDFFEQVKPLARYGSLIVDEARDVAAGPSQARNKAFADRIGDRCENYRNRSSFTLHGGCAGGGVGRNHVRLPGDQLAGKFLDALRTSASEANFNVQVTPVGPSEFF